MDRGVDHAGKLFGGFIEHVDAFRLLMRKYGALVAGSSVLRLFVDDHAIHSGQQAQAWVPSDLDVYVSRRSLGGVGLLDWHVHFTRAQGMTFDEQREQQYDGGDVSGSSLL
jgi:hypothetical protein